MTAWVQAIARYKLADHFRARGRREALHDPLDEEGLFDEADAEPGEASRDLGRLLEQLPDKQRLPIIHVKLEGLSVEKPPGSPGFPVLPSRSAYTAGSRCSRT